MDKIRKLDTELAEEYFFAKNANMPVGDYLNAVKINMEIFREKYNSRNKLEENIKE